MNKKMIAVAVVAFLALGALPIIGIAEESDATTNAHGTYSVYTYDGSTWDNQKIINAYDAAQAVTKMTCWNSTCVMKAKWIPGTWVTYQPEKYGDITTFRGLTEENGNVWNQFVKVGAEWQVVSPSLGCYTCFDDYNAEYQTANVCLYYGTAMNSLPVNPETAQVPLSSITTVTDTDGYQFEFTFKVDPTTGRTMTQTSGLVKMGTNQPVSPRDFARGFTIQSYGSNAALALDRVLNDTDLVMETQVPGKNCGTYYEYQGWIDTMFGEGTEQTKGTETPNDWTDDKYTYWQMFDVFNGFNNPSNQLSDFVLGAYSAVPGAPNYTTALTFGYAEYEF